ncbi:MAG TPA: hypothetical protein VFI61_01860 [Patescibacteria group bacterium]|nr:hypothetical protein [Patescibacteria group bacterium]
MKFSIRLLYLYLFSFIGLLITVIGAVQLVDLGIKVYVFKGADRYDNFMTPVKVDPTGKEVALSEKDKEEQKRLQDIEATRNRQRQTSTAASMILVGVPLYLYHWKKIKAS